MTDVADWTGVAAGPARIASTQNFTLGPGVSRTFNVSLTFTDRSLVLLGNQGVTGAFDSTQVSVVGHTTGTNYLQAQWWQGLFPTSDLPPLTVPAYGVADASVDITVKNNLGGTNLTYSIWVVAVPDEVMVGSSADPIAATPGGQPLGPPGAVTAVNSSTPYDTVALVNPAAGNDEGLIGVRTNPLHVAEMAVSETTGAIVTASNVSATLVPAPAAGGVRRVQNIYVGTGTVGAQVIVAQINGVDVALGILQTTSGSVLPGPWYLTAHPLTIVTSGGTASVVASWDDR